MCQFASLGVDSFGFSVPGLYFKQDDCTVNFNNTGLLAISRSASLTQTITFFTLPKPQRAQPPPKTPEQTKTALKNVYSCFPWQASA